MYYVTQAGVNHIILAVSYRAEMLEQEMGAEAIKVWRGGPGCGSGAVVVEVVEVNVVMGGSGGGVNVSECAWVM